jgi:hypothetical protein
MDVNIAGLIYVCQEAVRRLGNDGAGSGTAVHQRGGAGGDCGFPSAATTGI